MAYEAGQMSFDQLLDEQTRAAAMAAVAAQEPEPEELVAREAAEADAFWRRVNEHDLWCSRTFGYPPALFLDQLWVPFTWAARTNDCWRILLDRWSVIREWPLVDGLAAAIRTMARDMGYRPSELRLMDGPVPWVVMTIEPAIWPPPAGIQRSRRRAQGLLPTAADLLAGRVDQ